MFRMKTEEKAIEFLKEKNQGKDVQDVVKGILDLVPNSSREKYGKTDTITAANYLNEVLMKNNVIDETLLLSGGGNFRIKKSSIYGEEGALFTYLPMDFEKGLIVKLGSSKPVMIANDELLVAIAAGVIEETYLSKGKNLKKIDQKKQMTSKEEKDFKKAAKYLKTLFAKYNVESVNDFIEEVDMILTLIPDSLLDEYPKTREGQVIAVADYVEANEEDIKRLLRSRALMQKSDKSSGILLDTGTMVVSVKEMYGFRSKTAYLCYFDSEQDRFFFAPFQSLEKDSKAGAVVLGLVAVAATAAVVMVFPGAAATVVNTGVRAAGVAKAGVAAVGAKAGAAFVSMPGSLAIANAAAGVAPAATGALATTAKVATSSTGAMVAAVGAASAAVAVEASTMAAVGGATLAVASATTNAIVFCTSIDDATQSLTQLSTKDARYVVSQPDPNVDILEVYLSENLREYSSLPPVLSLSREALKTVTEQEVILADENVAKRLRYIF